ncbi:MAG: hypothetical protein HYU66_03905 [Armatimonadetes bacterium]|nr:hypothetical protein [Armatimonadota bacterium]
MDRLQPGRTGRQRNLAELADSDLRLDGDTLKLTLTSNLGQPAPAEVTLFGQRQTVTLSPGKPTLVAVDLGKPARDAMEPVNLEVKAGDLSGARAWALRTVRETRSMVPVPTTFKAGLCLRNGEENGIFAGTGAMVHLDPDMSCGGKALKGIFMHPPYQNGVGYSYALLDEVTLPVDPPVVFRCQVGKRDGGDLGDGILFIVSAVDEAGKATELARQHVAKYEWRPLEADLSDIAGKTVRLKLTSDVGPADDSSADWACWGDMRIESKGPVLTRTLLGDSGEYRTVPGPYPVAELTAADLRGAKRGWLRYDGCGLSGTGEYGTVAVVNDHEPGDMAPAGGDEVNGVWVEKVGVPLTAEAIAGLGGHNQFRIQNPRHDYYKVRNFWIELELADGRKASSRVAAVTYTQPAEWPYFEGIGVPMGTEIAVDIWFDLAGQ